MKLPKKIGDVEPLPHKVKRNATSIICDHCNTRIRVKFYIEKVSPQKYMDFFTCDKCLTRYNISVITKTGLKLRSKLNAMARTGQVGKEFEDIHKRYTSMVSDPEARVVRPEAQ